MNLPTIIQLVTSPYQAIFVRFQDQQLWYEITFPKFGPDGSKDEFLTFEFPVPAADTNGATFLPEDTPIFFMRWIRKHMEFLKQSFEDRPE